MPFLHHLPLNSKQFRVICGPRPLKAGQLASEVGLMGSELFFLDSISVNLTVSPALKTLRKCQISLPSFRTSSTPSRFSSVWCLLRGMQWHLHFRTCAVRRCHVPAVRALHPFHLSPETLLYLSALFSHVPFRCCFCEPTLPRYSQHTVTVTLNELDMERRSCLA